MGVSRFLRGRSLPTDPLRIRAGRDRWEVHYCHLRGSRSEIGRAVIHVLRTQGQLGLVESGRGRVLLPATAKYFHIPVVAIDTTGPPPVGRALDSVIAGNDSQATGRRVRKDQFFDQRIGIVIL